MFKLHIHFVKSHPSNSTVNRQAWLDEAVVTYIPAVFQLMPCVGES